MGLIKDWVLRRHRLTTWPQRDVKEPGTATTGLNVGAGVLIGGSVLVVVLVGVAFLWATSGLDIVGAGLLLAAKRRRSKVGANEAAKPGPKPR